MNYTTKEALKMELIKTINQYSSEMCVGAITAALAEVEGQISSVASYQNAEEICKSVEERLCRRRSRDNGTEEV